MFNLSPLPRTLEAAARDLTHAEKKVRLDAIRDLARLPDESELRRRGELLASALGDKDAAVRRAAAVSLGDLRAAHARDSLLQCLGDVDLGVRAMAAMALGEVCEPGDQRALGPLSTLLSAGDPSLRYQALGAYCALEPGWPGAELLRAFEDSDPELRELAARLTEEYDVLASAPSSKKRQQLLSALERLAAGEAPHSRLLAQLVLAEQGHTSPTDMIAQAARRQFRCREPRDEQRAIICSGRLGLQEARYGLRLRAFGSLGFSFDPFRWLARGALARMGEDRAKIRIARGLRARSPLERNLAVQAAGEAGMTELAPVLAQLRSDEQIDSEFLDIALAALGEPHVPDDSTS